MDAFWKCELSQGRESLEEIGSTALQAHEESEPSCKPTQWQVGRSLKPQRSSIASNLEVVLRSVPNAEWLFNSECQQEISVLLGSQRRVLLILLLLTVVNAIG
jgi:hypothetical protein